MFLNEKHFTAYVYEWVANPFIQISGWVFWGIEIHSGEDHV